MQSFLFPLVYYRASRFTVRNQSPALLSHKSHIDLGVSIFSTSSTLIDPCLDCQGKRIENGVYLGGLGYLTFEGRLSWKKQILAFIFEHVRIKIGPFNPLEIGLGQQGDREPSTKDPFFIWFYIDEEIAVARGKSGGTAFWCRCRRVTNFC